MKKVFVPLLILPLLASCSGFPVSRDDALAIIDNVHSSVEPNSATSYTSTMATSTNDGTTTVVSIYSRENKFFHTYTIRDREEGQDSIAESWKFVRESITKVGDEEISNIYIYDVVTSLSKVDSPKGTEIKKQYVTTYVKYTPEAWDEVAKDYESRLSRRFFDALDHSKNLVNDLSNNIELKSFNGSSLYLKNINEVKSEIITQQDEYELSFSNGRLDSIKTLFKETNNSTKTTKFNNVETTYSYSVGDIIYPDYKTPVI